jgi:hypothetical protein
MLSFGGSPVDFEEVPSTALVETDAFNFDKNQRPRTKNAARQARWRASKEIRDSIQSVGNADQQAQALLDACSHPVLQPIAKAVFGLDKAKQKAAEAALFTVRQQQKMIAKASYTQKKQGQICNDRRALVNTVLTASAASPNHKKSQPSVKQRAEMFGLKFDRARRLFKKAEQLPSTIRLFF